MFFAFLFLSGFLAPGAGRVSMADEPCCECFNQLVPHTGSSPGSTFMVHHLKLEGIASGGELVLMEMLNPNPRYIRIDTRAGETAETVMARMAEAFNEVLPFNPDLAKLRIRIEKGEVPRDKTPVIYPIRSEGNLLKYFGGNPGGVLWAGTETGLGIPPPPTSLSVSYDPKTQEVSLRWENPDEPYDAVGGGVGGPLAGTATRAVRKVPPPRKRIVPPHVISRSATRANKGLRRFLVVGCRGGVLSNAAVMTLDYEDNSQQELDSQPFTAGICPNWKAWSFGGEPGTLVLEQGTKGPWKRFDQEPRTPLEPEDRQYFQWIRTRSPAVVGGVCRKFLGLQPGHTYRIHTRMNTFDMDRVEGNWSFSFHAIPHGKSVTLSAQQMAGTAPLPDGSAGPQAGQVASCGPGSTTRGRFVEYSTEKAGPSAAARDITLPPGAEVITVWFRYGGPPCSGVGFDWLKLKDITTR